ncbi:MAG: hypothetical protein HQL53_13520 [Magnetococcales bacterium]|nr:hypothetical protein [Magnetococcales bacterium]
MSSGKQYLFDNPKNVRFVVRALVGICLLLFLLDAVLYRHLVHPWEGIFGFYAIYGFVGCVLLVLLAKEMRQVVMRAEDFYEKGRLKSAPVNAEKEDGGDA